MAVAGGVATFATGGLAAAPIALVLGVTGTGTGLVSGGLNIWNAKENDENECELKEKVRKILKDDAEAIGYFNNMCEKILTTHSAQNHKIFRELHMLASGFGCIAVFYGVEKALSVLASCLIPMAEFISNEAVSIASGSILIMNQIVKETAEAASEEVAKNVGKKAAKVAGRKAAREVIKKAGQKAAKETGEIAAQQAAKKAGEKAAKKVAQKAAQKAAAKAAEETAKTAAKVTGVLLLCLIVAYMLCK